MGWILERLGECGRSIPTGSPSAFRLRMRVAEVDAIPSMSQLLLTSSQGDKDSDLPSTWLPFSKRQLDILRAGRAGMRIHNFGTVSPTFGGGELAIAVEVVRE